MLIDSPVEYDVEATVRDGTVLRADVYRPDEPGEHPVLVCRTPYGKERDQYVEVATELASAGYVVVVQDIRGRGESDGEWYWQFVDKTETMDGPDGYDTIEWAARLAGSDGRVGTWGHSYPSWCIWMLAGEQPPSLKAIFASGMAANSLEMNFGIFETGRRLQWTNYMAPDARKRVGDSTGAQSRDEAEDWWHNVDRGKWVWFLPFEDIPNDAFSTVTPLLKRFYRDQSKDLWRFDEVHPRVNVPTCQLTGWYDRLIGTINNYTGVVEKGPGELRDQHRIVIGPWGHNVGNMSRSFGPWDLGPEAESTYAAEILRWYDYQFKRIDTGLGAEPPIKLFVLGENRWRFENEWPLARTRFTDFFLHSDGSANTPAGDGVLLEEPLGEGKPDRYDYDPKDPVMSLMGLNSQAAPRGQTSLATRRDILVYQTLPLAEDVEVTGPVELKLWASSTAPDTDFTAKLVDVWPDGTAVNLTYGILRAQYRDGFDTPKLLEPENPYELKISLNPTCVLFKRGHRIRLDVSSSDFPNFDRNHNTGNDFWSDTELRVARQTVFHDGERRSRLVLPVIPR